MKPRLLAYAVGALAVWLVVALVGRSSAITSERQAVAEVKELTAFSLAQAARIKRLQADSVSRLALQAERDLLRQRARLSGSMSNLTSQLDTARAVLADTLATLETLRVTLAVTVAQSDSLIRVVNDYQAASDSVLAKHAAERKALYAVIAAKDTALTASHDAMRAWKGAATCKVLVFRCPTRTQSFIGGAIVTAAVIVAVGR